ARGRPLVANTSTQVVTVNRDLLQSRPDKGRSVLIKLAALLGTSAQRLAKEITPCSPKVPAPCWTGQPFAPVPVKTNAPTSVVLAISERREDFPGVAVQTVTQPTYPNGTLAAQLLGYTSDITEADKTRNSKLTDADTIGVAGLEEQYDAQLRGVDGQQIVALNPQGYTVATGAQTPAQQGNTLVTSIDLDVQRLAEQALIEQLKAVRKQGKKGTGGAVVVMDPDTGRILAAASYPTYDPTQFIGGISAANYRKLTAPGAGDPLISRAVNGAYAPGSTFKLITTSSLVMHKEINTTDRYGCPGALSIDGRVKTNFDSEGRGPIDLENALGYSCDTFFYAPAAAEYYRDQNRIAKGEKPQEYLQHMAAAYGVGRAPGIDLPGGEQASGSYADRESRMARWKANRAQYCAAGRRGYPEVKDRAQRAYLTALAKENCTDGWRYRAGDNADLSIGQGETTVSPLQLALAYSALVNGGKIWAPTLGWAVVDPTGKVVQKITPKVRNTVPVSQSLFNYITKSLSFSRGWAVSGAWAYIGSPLAAKLGGKTGTAEVYGKQDTSWLASWGPTYKTHGGTRARFVVVGMLEQAGIGAMSAGPMLKQVWEGLLPGADGTAIYPAGQPIRTLPNIVAARSVTGR
ncbi:MAG TPA: penicillin-binding transpeptidase domain-containing protein, partial [Jatrophihabitans sp.]|nr:penicillin-binding transpeptidase domain-containing protein [Jatrophihabitans sp.]